MDFISSKRSFDFILAPALVIPESFAGKPVVAVMDGGFDTLDARTTVTGIVYIGERCFGVCTTLTSLQVPEGVRCTDGNTPM